MLPQFCCLAQGSDIILLQQRLEYEVGCACTLYMQSHCHQSSKLNTHTPTYKHLYIYIHISDWINGSMRLRVELKLFDCCSQCYSLSLLSLRVIPWTYSKTEISPHRRYCSPFIRCSRHATFQPVFNKIILLNKDIPPQSMRPCSSLPISHSHLAKRAHFSPN